MGPENGLTGGADSLTAKQVAAIRRSRRHPRLNQFDYLHLRYLVTGLAEVLRDVTAPVEEALDVWCGSRPYEDLLPEGAQCVGLDLPDNPYGVADVTSDEILPFPERSFDLLLCTEAFQFVPDPEAAVAEFRRVLRDGGTAVIALPFAFEYDPRILERRFTGPHLVALFEGWEDVRLREHGGRVVAWVVLTASLLRNLELRLRRARGLGPFALVFPALYVALNVLGLALARLERHATGAGALPMNLLLTARRPPMFR
jgi:SAM-dependent methyltransferase